MNPIEQKAVAHLDVKFATTEVDTETRSFSGYGAVFGNVDSYGDVIAPGAFAKSLAQHKADGSSPLMFLNHDAFGSLPIGKWTDLSEDGYGLKASGQLLDTTSGRDTYVALKAGAITGLSIGYRPIAWDMRSKPEDPRRTLKEIDLHEVSVVTLPANQKARVQAVKCLGEEMNQRDLEQLLRECGLSKSEAIAVASQFDSKKDIEERATSAAIASLAAKMRAH